MRKIDINKIIQTNYKFNEVKAVTNIKVNNLCEEIIKPLIRYNVNGSGNGNGNGSMYGNRAVGYF